MDSQVARTPVLVIGGGPAGLTAAYELAQHGIPGVLVEADGVVGGIARTVERDGYRFDIGGHRFFTKVPEIEQLWDQMLGEPMLRRPRLSRIYYNGRFFDYPLRGGNVLRNLGLITSLRCMLSYLRARLRPIRQPHNLEEWVSNQFGRQLYRIFFKSYTEKVWGIPCTQISADWAAQRIKGLSLAVAVRNALLGSRGQGTVKTLIEEFKYPRLGPGQLWEACARTIEARGWQVRLNTRVTGLTRQDNRIVAAQLTGAEGRQQTIQPQHVISSMPLRELVTAMIPAAPAAVASAAKTLGYRDFLVVALVLETGHLWDDNWIYIHAPEVRVGRIQNFKNWSPAMVPEGTRTCLGMEYFVQAGDELWSMPDEKLVAFAYKELQALGLGGAPLVRGYVVRMPKAYPVYTPGYTEQVAMLRRWLAEVAINLQCVGRNGQHRYNNQDHSMATALIAARKIATGDTRDPWAVNEDAEYHEIAQTERAVPPTPADVAGQ